MDLTSKTYHNANRGRNCGPERPRVLHRVPRLCCGGTGTRTEVPRHLVQQSFVTWLPVGLAETPFFR